MEKSVLSVVGWLWVLPLFGCGYVGFELAEPSVESGGVRSGGGTTAVDRDGSTGRPPDASVRDGSVADGATGDGAIVDASGPDGSIADGGPLDAGDVDAAMPPACDLGTHDHCGACDDPCREADYAAVGQLVCVGSQCMLGACLDGFGDCDGALGNGCETDLNTLSDCGACGQSCAADQAMMACNVGQCEVVGCTAGYDDCDGLAGNGCERSLMTLADCGACGQPCEATNGMTQCDAQNGCELVGCAAGYADCDTDDLGNGCETPTNTLADCGGCGATCAVPAGVPSCTGGRCTAAACTMPNADCDSDDSDCETRLDTLTDCGACGAACGVAGRLDHASATCAAGACEVDMCDALYANCDNSHANGCERPINTLSDCGGCGVPCAAPRATTDCETGSCELTECMVGYGDCTGGLADGCETSLDTVSHCGACNNVCVGGEQCIAASCVGFAIPPSNLGAADLDASTAPQTTFDCGVTQFNSTSLTFSNPCGQAVPAAQVIGQPSGPDLVVLVFRALTVGPSGALVISGSRPVALAVTGDVNILGGIKLDANANVPGPGGNQSCGTSAGRDGTGSSSAGGGGGGGAGFGTAGARGGTGDGRAAGNGGVARGDVSLVPLLAGCAGGTGGGCSSGIRGAGAGALQISSAAKLTVSGTISAVGGHGSQGCGTEGGGGGGGSGGGLLLEAVDLEMTGTLIAHGGNGGRGSGGGSGGAGATGAAGPTVGAAHGSNGGGGGGGAAGRIRLAGQLSCSISGGVSPPPSTACP